MGETRHGVSEEKDDLDHEAQRWAADEPTAMWDDSEMKAGGYDALAEDRQAKPRGETGPATGRSAGGMDDSSIQLSRGPVVQRAAAAAPRKPGGISWVLTILLSLGLGVGVFILIRALL